MRPTFVLIASLVLAFAAAACDDASDDPVPTSTPLAAHGELVVYRELVMSPLSPPHLGTQTSPTWRIAAYDLDAGREVSSFMLGTEDEPPVDAWLVGQRVAVLFGTRVMTYALDGSEEWEWYSAPEGAYITGAAPSPNAKLLAVSLQRGDPCATATPIEDGGMCPPTEDFMSVLVVDQVGQETFSIPQTDDRFGDFPYGYFSRITWRDAGDGFVVALVVGGEAPAVHATVMLDQNIVVSPVRGYFGYVSPNGRYIYGDDWVVCDMNLATERHALRIVDLVTDEVLAATVEPVRNIAPLQEWSPDGDELVYRTAELNADPDPSSGCPRENMETATWHILRAGSDALIDVAGVIEARRGWYGDRLIEFECGGEPTEYSECIVGGSSGPASVLNQGRLITTAAGYETIGYLPANAAE